MASGSDNTEDDTYDSALQRLMKECLPPILVEIVDRRPPDPIQYMAKSLYKYREKDDAAMFKSQPSRIQSVSDSSISNLESKHDKNFRSEGVRQGFLAKGMIVESNDDFIEVNEDFEAFDISNKMVHEQCTVGMKLIGDIFDEEDIS